MPSPHGSIIDLNTIQKYIGYLKRFLDRNAMDAAKYVSDLILTEFTAIDADIQAATTNQDLATSPTLPIRVDIDPDPGIANSDGSAGSTDTTITAG